MSFSHSNLRIQIHHEIPKEIKQQWREAIETAPSPDFLSEGFDHNPEKGLIDVEANIPGYGRMADAHFVSGFLAPLISKNWGIIGDAKYSIDSTDACKNEYTFHPEFRPVESAEEIKLWPQGPQSLFLASELQKRGGEILAVERAGIIGRGVVRLLKDVHPSLLPSQNIIFNTLELHDGYMVRTYDEEAYMYYND